MKLTGNPAMDAMLEDIYVPKDKICIASGKIIRSGDVHFKCKVCRHPMITTHTRGLQACPLCHSGLPLPDARGTAASAATEAAGMGRR
jgi:WD repeat-containing protein 35